MLRLVIGFLLTIYCSLAVGQIEDEFRVSGYLEGIEVYLEIPCREFNNSHSQTFDEPKLFHLVRIKPCDARDEKLRGIVYLKIQIDNRDYYLKPSDVNFNLDIKDYLKRYRKLTVEERVELEKFYRSENKGYYDEIRQKEEEERERVRLEEERKERERETAKQLEIAKNDSIKATESALLIFYEEMMNDSLQDKIDKLIEKADEQAGIFITEYDVFDNGYDVTDVSFRIFNCSKTKRIKYIYFKVRAFNGVNDQVGRTETLKGIGFVEPYQFSTWDFENVWFERTLETVSILSVVLEFEDGSKRTISDPGRFILKEALNFEENATRETYTHINYGSICMHALIGGDPDKYSFHFNDLQYETRSGFAFEHSDISSLVSDLDDAISSLYSDREKSKGHFQTTNYSSGIYFYNDSFYKTWLTKTQANDLLTFLKKLITED